MAKDDYDYIVFKILVYLYGVLKRKYVFNEVEFLAAVGDIDSDYLTDILYMIREEGLITGAVFTKVWGGTIIRTGRLSDIKITSAGIHYLKDNSVMQRMKDYILENVANIAKLVVLVLGK